MTDTPFPRNGASELELPRVEKRLPTAALTLTQVETLRAVPSVADPLGVRDRAMLGLFYSCGLGRAELCRLELTDLNPERRTLTIRRGKGKKDRVVPVGGRAVAWVERYLQEVRPRLCLDTRTAALFLTGYGEAFNPDVLSRMVAGWMKVAGLKGSCHLLRSRARPICSKAGSTSVTTSSCLDTRSSRRPPFTPKSPSASCRKSTPVAIPRPDPRGRFQPR